MNKTQAAKLKAAGFTVGNAQDFLGLSPAEAAYVEVRLALAKALRDCRTKHHLTQAAFAKKVHSSQSRVAKMEAGDPSVSVDLMIRSMMTLGATAKDVGRAIAGGRWVA